MMLPAQIHCWLILLASLVIMSAAVIGLVTERYHETMPENIGLTAVALCGFVVVMQIGSTGFAHISGVTALVVSVAGYAVALVLRQRRECVGHEGVPQ